MSAAGAASVAGLIRHQKITRYSQGWEQSLRFRSVDPDTLPGLKKIVLNGNIIGDDGVGSLAEILKEDEWIKVLELQACGLTDVGGQLLIECLNINKTLLVLNLRENDEIAPQILEHIRTMLGGDSEETGRDDGNTTNSSLMKPTITQLR